MLLFDCAVVMQMVVIVFSKQLKSSGQQDKKQNPEINWQHTFTTKGHQMKTDGPYNLQWSSDENTVTFNVTVETLGWVGLGFSKDGAMTGADIVIGWVSNGIAYLTDRSAEGHILPQLDKQQDYILIYGAETDKFTTLVFKRTRNTGDCNDMVLDATAQVILLWAWSPDDPADTGPQYHQTNRGTVDITLSASEKSKQNVVKDKDELFYDIRLNKVRPQRKAETIYWNTFIPFPKLEKKHHIIRMEPLIEPGHESWLHHFTAYYCYGDIPQELVNFSDESINLPPDADMCTSTFYMWTVGSVSTRLPEDVGVSIGEKGDPQYVRLNAHFDNPNLPDDFEDSSGFRIVYTPNLRPHDAAMLVLGSESNVGLAIPPGENGFIARGWCLGQCTQKYASLIPKEGLTIVGVGPHTHEKGRAIKLTQFRNGIQLNTLMQLDDYDPNTQNLLLLKNRVTLLPGDDLLTECLYDTSKLQTFTYGGNSFKDEMCMTLLYYYPKIDLAYCISVPQPKPLLEKLGLKDVRNFPLKPNRMEMENAINSLDWKDQSLRDKYYQLLNTTDMYLRCEQMPMPTYYPQEEGPTPVLKDYSLDQHYRRKPNQCGGP